MGKQLVLRLVGRLRDCSDDRDRGHTSAFRVRHWIWSRWKAGMLACCEIVCAGAGQTHRRLETHLTASSCSKAPIVEARGSSFGQRLARVEPVSGSAMKNRTQRAALRGY